MTTLTVVADIRAEPGQGALVRAALEKLLAPTRAEAGCLIYDLHTDNDDPEHFVFYETWESRALWLDHMESAHITAFRQAAESALASLVVSELTNTREA